MKCIRAAALGFAIGALAAGGAPAVAKNGSGAGFGVSAGRASAGAASHGMSRPGGSFRHQRRGNGFSGFDPTPRDLSGDRAGFRVRGKDLSDRPFGGHRFRDRNGFRLDEGLLGYREGWPRHNRTSLANGYFGQDDGDYDRGYPYDYYQDRSDPREMDDGFYHSQPPRRLDCRTVQVPSESDRGRVPVNICRG